jgi:predicted kinase
MELGAQPRSAPKPRQCAVTSPTLVVVSGPAGSGKTTLAHHLARAIGCPAICRDEIKEGMVHATRHFEPTSGDALTMRTLPLFFSILRLFLEGGVTVVAEASFQDKLWRPNLEPLAEFASLRIVQCHTDPETARRRVIDRAASRTAHADAEVIDDVQYFDDFCRVAISAMQTPCKPTVRDVATRVGLPTDGVICQAQVRCLFSTGQHKPAAR